MKKLQVVIILLVVILMGANAQDKKFSIVGTWVYDRVEISLKSNNAEYDKKFIEYLKRDLANSSKGQYETYAKDGTCINSYNDRGTYTSNGKTVIVQWYTTDGEDDYEDVYRITENELSQYAFDRNLSGNEFIANIFGDNAIENATDNTRLFFIEVSESNYLITKVEITAYWKKQ